MRYEEGQGVPQDDKTALKWYRLAAEQGHVAAQLIMQKMYGETIQQTDESTNPSPFEMAKKQGASIGFKEGTEKFGDCVMKLYKRFSTPCP